MDNKVFLFAFILLVGAINPSCDNEDNKIPTGTISPIVDAELPASGKVGQTINFIVSHAVFNGCGYYSSQETTRIGHTLIVTFYAQYPKDRFCTMDVPVRKTNYTFTPAKTGTYTFKFNGGETGHLIKTIRID